MNDLKQLLNQQIIFQNLLYNKITDESLENAKEMINLFESTGIPQIKLDPRNNFTRYLLLRELITINDFNYWRRTNDSKKSQNTVICNKFMLFNFRVSFVSPDSIF